MMAAENTKTERTRTEALPYVYARMGLDFDATGYAVDDGNIGTIEDDADRQLSLENLPGWETTTIQGTIEITEDLIKRVFPEDERDEPPGKLIVTTDCLNTHNRFGKEVVDAPVEADEYQWEIDINRDDVRERVVLNAYLVRTADGSHESSRYASYHGQRVADGMPWSIQIDEPDDWLGGHMVVRFKSFSDSVSSVPDDNLYYLDRTNPEQPRVWVNSDHKPIESALSSGGYTGFRPRMREVISSQIAHQIWVELLMWTASDATEDGDLEYDWQEAVLTEVGSKMYDEDAPIAIAQQLHEAVREPENIPQLMDDINEALQEYIDPQDSLNEMIRREG
ncbi:hypothetical protein [Halalkalicoccus salilacus]|uniref:hypothetical protein n=2 Tax=Halococcaceae TaxID=1963270 RepID=UPI0036147FDB